VRWQPVFRQEDIPLLDDDEAPPKVRLSH
jgi:hypothetical protein